MIYFLDFYISFESKATIFIADALHQSDKSLSLVLSLLRPLHNKAVENFFGVRFSSQQNFDLWNEVFMEIAVVNLEMIVLGPNFRCRFVLTT